ncbi:hypothetical protein N0V87_005660 [Didymella glomerata]|uniref:Uncharacterized protein n=1 Tax=Didymella glomerata TaxID=749621 RepID=A0A9W9BZK0_9PLEO|nr:hypothetical protein N0V87_005660 [Didymella glomerata]
MKLVTTTVVFISLTFTTLAAPANPSTPAHDVAPTFPAPSSSPPGNYCGKALLTGTGRLRELRTSELWYKCITLDQGENYGPCINQNDDCQGDITYWGGKGAGAFDAKGARSYYCV